MEDLMPEQVDVAWRKQQPMKSPCWSKLLAGTAACGEEPTWEHVIRQELWPCGGPTLEQFVSDRLQPVRRTHIWEVGKGLSLIGGTPRWSRERVWGGRSSKDNAWWTDCNLHSPSPSTTWRGEEVEELGMKLSLGWGRRFVLISYCITICLMGNKLK